MAKAQVLKNKKKNARAFRKTANKMDKTNIVTGNMRGGIRM